MKKNQQMKKKRPRNKKNDDQTKYFRQIQSYMNEVAKGDMRKHKLFTLCVRASARKCFEFNLALPQLRKTGGSFFAISSLRGICEDLIVLSFIGTLPSTDREKLVGAISSHELATRMKLQGAFFDSFRPQQPVVRWKDIDRIISDHATEARKIWNNHGWPSLSTTAMPQIRQIAEKKGAHHLAILYDYLYRLTSGGVHFSVQSLLRSGWGPLPQLVFSTKNFNRYFSEYCALYGAFMFCLYFELFSSILRPRAKERAIVAKIRSEVYLTRRWPEMVTFEEMNQPLPKGGEILRLLLSTTQATSRKRLIPLPTGANKGIVREVKLAATLAKTIDVEKLKKQLRL